MTGPHRVLVDRVSAVQRGSQKSDVLPINQSHSNMVKLKEGSIEYNVVVRCIYELSRELSDQLEDAKSKIVATNTELHFTVDEHTGPSADYVDKGRSLL
jgi:hypothetical protein